MGVPARSHLLGQRPLNPCPLKLVSHRPHLGYPVHEAGSPIPPSARHVAHRGWIDLCNSKHILSVQPRRELGGGRRYMGRGLERGAVAWGEQATAPVSRDPDAEGICVDWSPEALPGELRGG